MPSKLVPAQQLAEPKCDGGVPYVRLGKQCPKCGATADEGCRYTEIADAHNKGWIAATIAMSEECDRIKSTMPQQWLPSDAQGIWNGACDRLRATICAIKPSPGSAPFLEALTAAEARGSAAAKAEIAALTEQRDP